MRIKLFPVFSYAEQTRFYSQLHALLKSGVSLARALKVLGDLEAKAGRKRIIHEISGKIRRGSDLSDAMADFGAVFDRTAVEVIRAGEISGSLNHMLAELVKNREQTLIIRSGIVQAMTYPLVLIGVSLAVMAVMLVVVVPEFASMFQKFGAELPPMTRAVVNASEFLQHNFAIILGIFLSLILAVKLLLNLHFIKIIIHRLMLFLPLAGTVTREGGMAQFAALMNLLSRADIKLVTALNTSATAMKNKYFAARIAKAAVQVSRGDSLSASFAKDQAFPDFLSHMTKIGEETGDMANAFLSVANFYNERINKYIIRLKTLLEPAMILLISMLIGIMLIAMYQPIFKLNQLF